MKATLRNVRISPKKLNLVAGLIRNQRVNNASDILQFTPKKGADILRKALESAVANAESNFKQKRDDLVIKEIKVSKGFTLRRYIPQSRGRAHGINKVASHVHIFLENVPAETTKKKVAPKKEEKSEKKTKAKKTTTKKSK